MPQSEASKEGRGGCSLTIKSGRLRKDIERDVVVLDRFVRIFCEKKHETPKGGDLCNECADLLAYGLMRLEKCPYNPKPKCKDCETHCYKPDYRKRVQEVMRFSGTYYVKRGRLDWLAKYFF